MTPTSQESGPTWTTFTKGASKHKDSLCLWFIALSIPTVESPTHLSALHSDQISRVIEYLDTWDKYHTHWMGSLLIRSSSNSNTFVCLSWTAWHSFSKKSCSTLYHSLMFLPWSMTLTLHIKVNQSSGQKVYVLTDCVWEQQHKKNCLLLYHFLPTYTWKIVWPVNEPFGKKGWNVVEVESVGKHRVDWLMILHCLWQGKSKCTKLFKFMLNLTTFIRCSWCR